MAIGEWICWYLWLGIFSFVYASIRPLSIPERCFGVKPISVELKFTRGYVDDETAKNVDSKVLLTTLEMLHR